MEKISTSSFLHYRFVSDPQFSFDGRYVSYVVQTADLEKNRYAGDIFLVDGATTRSLTSQGDAKSVCWTPQNTVLFPALREKAHREAVARGEELTDYYEISPEGGEAILSFTLPMKAKSLIHVYGEIYYFIGEYDLTAVTAEEKRKKHENAEIFEVYEENPFWKDNVGIVNGKRNRLYLYDRSKKKVTLISPEEMEVTKVSHTGEKIIYSAADYIKKVQNQDVHIFTYDVVSGISRCVLKPGKLMLRFCEVWGEIWGDQILVIGSDGKTYGRTQSPSFWLLDPDSGELTLFKEYPYGINYRCVGNDSRLGKGQGMKVVGDRVYFLSTVGYRTYVRYLDKSGNISELLTPDGVADGFDVTNGRLVYSGFYGDKLAEIYENGHPLTHENNLILAGLQVIPPRHHTFLSSDGVEVDGWAMPPAGYQPGKKYPAILHVHGGPRSLTGELFFNEQQVWANAGYFVFFCNPRGSEGKGDAFADIWAKYGTIDYQDIMEFMDEMLKKYPDVDARRVGVTGGSYGGFMTNWIIGHTNRFKCAVTQRCIANMITYELTGDNGYYFVPNNLHADVRNGDFDQLWDFSPLKYLSNCVTPTMVIQSDSDHCCWMAEGIQAFNFLRLRGVDTKLYLFKGESHELSRSGRPKARIARMDAILEWMDRYLKG